MLESMTNINIAMQYEIARASDLRIYFWRSDMVNVKDSVMYISIASNENGDRCEKCEYCN